MFTRHLWPDFDEAAFAEALEQFAGRAAAVRRPVSELDRSAPSSGVVLIAVALVAALLGGYYLRHARRRDRDGDVLRMDADRRAAGAPAGRSAASSMPAARAVPAVDPGPETATTGCRSAALGVPRDLVDRHRRLFRRAGRFGRRKLAPSISPDKTVEGLCGGVAAAALLGGAWVACNRTRPAAARCLPRLFAVAAQVGDLFESGMKRTRGGQGLAAPGCRAMAALLDRLDGLVPVAVLTARRS